MFTRRSMLRPLSLTLLGAVLLLGVGVAAVNAGPVTNPGGAPFAKTSLYRKVLEILDAGGNRLELGSGGTDIAGSSNLIFRPSDTNGVLATTGAMIRSNGTNSDIYVPGDLCLYTHPGGVLNGTPDCRHVLSSGGGTTLWREGTGTDPYGTQFHLVEPIPLSGTSAGVHIGTLAQPVTGTPAISLSSSGFPIDTGVIANNYGNGDAALFQGTVTSNNFLRIRGRLLVGGREVWRPGYYSAGIPPNEGTLSKLVGEDYGLDADLANGNQVTVEPASSCADSNIGNTSFVRPHVACLCFMMKYSDIYSNGALDYVPNSVPTVKRCIDMANRF